MAKQLKPARISYHTWAGLMSGRISHVTEGASTLRFSRARAAFVMTCGTEEHALAASCTDTARLSVHWLGFAAPGMPAGGR